MTTYLLGSAVLKATLHKEIAKAVDHQLIRLGNNGIYNFVLLLRSADLELLLQEDRSLLIIVADDLVNDILPVAAHVAIQQATIVHRFHWRNVLGSATSVRRGLFNHIS